MTPERGIVGGDYVEMGAHDRGDKARLRAHPGKQQGSVAYFLPLHSVMNLWEQQFQIGFKGGKGRLVLAGLVVIRDRRALDQSGQGGLDPGCLLEGGFGKSLHGRFCAGSGEGAR